MPEFIPSSSFPLVLYDGQNEINVGNVEVHPSIDFKKLQSILSDKIGIGPDRLTVALMKSSPSRKIVLHESKSFSHILQKDKDCYFLVSLKSPTRRGRRGGRNRPLHQDHYFTSSSPPIESLSKRFLINPPQKVLLRRDSTATPFYDPISSSQSLRLGYRDYTSQLQIQKENYLMSMINSYPYADVKEVYGYGRSTGGGGCRAAVCDVCSNADGGSVPFHWCVYDATTVGFRSPAGPIARPSKD